MNQPEAEYWLAVAAQWIQSKTQTQMNFPNYPFSQLPQHIPAAPRISNNDATVNDNLVEADMDIEEEAKEEEEPPEIWANWESKGPQTVQSVQKTLPVTERNPSPQKHPAAKNQSNRTDSFNNSTRFVQAPSAPIISTNQVTESSHHSEDMVLDSDGDDDDTSSSMMEAQKRKKLPVWIREGLERIEREKKLEELRVQKEKELQQDIESRKRMMEEALKELEREKVTKSKYVSFPLIMTLNEADV